LSIFKTEWWKEIGNENVYALCDAYYNLSKIDIECDTSRGVPSVVPSTNPSTKPSLKPTPSSIVPIPNTPFYFEPTWKTWDKCESTAENNGLTFASIRNQAETDAVVDYLDSNNIAFVWLGGYQTSYEDEPAGNWSWLDETPWSDSTYTNWLSGQPNNIFDLGNEPDNLDNNEHHLYLRFSDGKWLNGNKELEWPCLLRDPTSSSIPTQNPTSSSIPSFAPSKSNNPTTSSNAPSQVPTSSSAPSQIPTSSSAPSFIDCSCGPGKFKFQLELKLDRKPHETSWNLQDKNGNILYNEGPYRQFLDKLKTFNYEYCFPVGCYDFTIHDSNGDGLSSGIIFNTDGHFKGRIYWREEEIFSGVNFGLCAIESFCVEDQCPKGTLL